MVMHIKKMHAVPTVPVRQPKGARIPAQLEQLGAWACWTISNTPPQIGSGGVWGFISDIRLIRQSSLLCRLFHYAPRAADQVEEVDQPGEKTCHRRILCVFLVDTQVPVTFPLGRPRVQHDAHEELRKHTCTVART